MKTITLRLVYETTLKTDQDPEDVKDDMMEEIFQNIDDGAFAYTEVLVDSDDGRTSFTEDPEGRAVPVEKRLEGLSDEMLEAAYRKRELDYRTEDFLEHARTYAEENGTDGVLTEEDARKLAKAFIMYVEDCNVPENFQIDGMLADYFGDEN